MLKNILTSTALVTLAACSSHPASPPDIVGTWKGNLNCPSKRLSAQEMTISLEEGLFSGLINGEIKNDIIRDGHRYHLHYTVAGATLGGKVRLKPQKMLQDTSNGLLYAEMFEANLTEPNIMAVNFNYCQQVKLFKRVSTPNPQR